jgi:hypothetical protein
MNPLFKTNNPYSNFINQVQELKKTIPDPKAEVQKMLNNGQITQEQINSAIPFIQQILPFFK